MSRPSIKSCSARGLLKLTEHLAKNGVEPMHMRRQLIFSAGVSNNRKLLKQLGSLESSNWFEGRRAADPDFVNPYWPDR